MKPKILLVDDEEWNISALTEILDRCNGREKVYDYVSSSYEGLQQLYESMKEDVPYNAIIADFNMDDMNGKQLLRALIGCLGYDMPFSEIEDLETFDEVREVAGIEEEVVDSVEDIFGTFDEYKAFVRYYEEQDVARILFSGSYHGDNQKDPVLNGDVIYIQKDTHAKALGTYIEKRPDEGNTICERDIIAALVTEGVLDPAKAEQALQGMPDYKAQNGLTGHLEE